MYLRKNNKTRLEVSIDEPLNVDWDGNELLLSDILGTDEDVITRDMEEEVERRLLQNAISTLSAREKTIIQLRFGLEQEERGGGYVGDRPVLYFTAGKENHQAAEERDCAF